MTIFKMHKLLAVTIFLMAVVCNSTAQYLNRSWPLLKKYKGENLAEIAMPLGGIGTGTISIGGRGDLRDWEMANHGALGWVPAVKLVEPTIANGPFFALYYKQQGKAKGELRLLEGPIAAKQSYGDWGSDVLNAGFPRFDETIFNAAYPLAQIEFKKADVPLSVRLEAFNPMIPGDIDNSSLPVAVLRYIIKNNTSLPMEASVCGMIPNFIGMDGWASKLKNNINEFRKQNGLQGLYMFSDSLDKTHVNWGTIALSTKSVGKVTYRRTWAKLGWNWTFREFIDDFIADGEVSEAFAEINLKNNVSSTIEDLMAATRYDLANPPATLAIKEMLAPGEEKAITFLITWHFPNRRAWDTGNNNYSWGYGSTEIVGNYYATQFTDAWDVALKVNAELTTLEKRTIDFVKAFCSSNIPDAIKEAALFNSVNMRCQTLFRTKDGYPFGFEGTGSVNGTILGGDKSSGWGFGTCFHVWNYESAIPFLFGDLSMKFREVEFLYSVNNDGPKATG